MADWRRALSKDEIPAAFRNVYGDRTEKPLSVKGAEIGVEFTPAGTIFGLNDIKNELQKENPDYYKVGMMAGLEAIGLIPGLDKVAIEAIRAGAKKVGLDKVADQTEAVFGAPKPNPELEVFGGANAENPPNMTSYNGIDTTFNAEADWQTLQDLGIDFEGDPSGSMVRMMDEIERNPDKYPSTLKEVVAGKWFRGRDNMMRFEIDDSQSEILGNGVGDIVQMDEDDMDAYLRGFSFNVDNKFPDNSIQGMPEEQAFSTLGNILKHDELYSQYPQLRNAPVIEDTTYFKRNPSVLGYFDETSGTIAINTNKIKTNEELRDTLLHEVQHLVQHLEGFEGGTNVRNADVLEIKKAIEGSPEYQKAFVDYNAKVSEYLDKRDSATAAVYNKNKEVASKVLDIILDDFSNKTQIPVEEIYERLNKGETFDQIKMSVSPDIRSRGFVYPPEFERILHIAEGNVGGMAPSSSIDLNRSLDDVNPRESAAPYFEMLSGKDKIDLVADNNRWQQNRLSSTISSLIKENPELAKDFENSLGFSAQDFIDASRSQDTVGQLYGIPNLVPPAKPRIVRNYVIYSTKRGEVEARNVSARKDMPASERTPENVFDTEDTPANRQWGEPELQKARAGQNPVTGFANGPSASETYRQNPKVEPEVEAAFTELADIQRGQPELAMVEAQMLYGGGVMPYALEHVGDLTHRMAERGGRYGEEFVQPKVTRLLDSLLSEYGFEKEMLENIQSNARFKYERDKPNISFEEYKKDYEQSIDKALSKYSEAHKKVPVYNQMQLAGREAAIAIGEKRYTDAIEHLYTIDQAIKDGTYNQIALEFDPNIDFRKRKEFAEGGAVGDMNRQMELFARGGLKDDGMNMDPVSGNEVPSGSLAEEVRDDIPAQLSEGEYVVPADVVRYYGVKHFEDLRNKAKKGLTQMEADGRIGGEPMMDEDITEQDIAAFERMLAIGAAEGGLMDKMAKAVKSNKMINDRANAKGLRVGYAAGGMTKATYDNPTRIDQVIDRVMGAARKDPNIMQELTKRGIEVSRTTPQMNPQEMDKANPMPETRKAFFQGGVTGLPMAPSQQLGGITPGMSQDEIYKYITTPTTIDPMYSVPGGSYIGAGVPVAPSAPAPEATTPAASPEYCASLGMMFDAEKNMCVPRPTSSDDGPDIPVAGDGKPAFQDWGKELNFTDYESMEEWAKGLSQPMKGGKLAKVAAAAMPGPIGLIAGVAPSVDALKDISDLNAARIIAKARGDDKMADMLEGYIEDRIKTSSGLVDMLDELVASGKQKADAYARRFNFDSMEDVMSIPSNRNKFTNFTTQYGTNMTFKPATESPGLSGDTEASKAEVAKEQVVMQQQVKPAAASPQPSNTNNDDKDAPTHAEIMEAHYGTGWSDTQTDEQEEASDVGFGSDTGGWTPEGFDFGQNRGGLIKRRK